MKELKGVMVEGVMINATKTERKRVILRDCEGSSFYVLLTDEQIGLLYFLQKNDLLDCEVRWEILLDEDWEKV